MVKQSPKRLILILAGGILCLLATQLLSVLDSVPPNPEQIGNEINEAYLDKIEEANLALIKYIAEHDALSYQAMFSATEKKEFDDAQELGLAILVFEADTLRFWSDNAVPIEPLLSANTFSTEVISLKNGWFAVHTTQSGARTYVGLTRIKSDYAHQNKYLKNAFAAGFPVPDNAIISTANAAGAIPVFSTKGEMAFSIILPPTEGNSGWLPGILVLLYLCGLILLLYSLDHLLLFLSDKLGGLNITLLFIGLVLLLRYLTLIVGYPSALYKLKLFSPTLFASSALFPSLGDFFINTVLLLAIIYHIHRRSTQFKLDWLLKSPLWRQFFFGATVVVLMGAGFVAQELTGNLIENSNINLKVNDVLSLTIYSFTGLLIIAILLLSLILLADAIVQLNFRILADSQSRWLLFVSLLAGSILWAALSEFHFHNALLAPIIFGIIAYHRSKLFSIYSFSGLVILLSYCSLHGAYILREFIAVKEEHSRLVLAEKLATNEDPVTEFLYSELEPLLQQEAVFRAPYENPGAFDRGEFTTVLKQKYFSGYWEKYELTFTFFGLDSIEIGGLLNVDFKEFAEYNRRLKEQGHRSEISPNLILIQNPVGRLSYVIKLDVPDTSQTQPLGHTYIELNSKLIPEEIGFPELLLDRSAGTFGAIADYSYARFVNNALVNVFGTFNYPVSPTVFLTNDTTRAIYMDYEAYNHLVYRVGTDSYLVLSKQKEEFLAGATTFSYMFAFFSSFLLIALLFRALRNGIQFSSINLKSRIQFMLIAVMLTSLILFALGAGYYIKSEYYAKNEKNISEKIHSVQIEVFNKLKGFSSLQADQEPYVNYLMQKFGNVFFTDINLYDPAGNILGTSQQRLFEKGLISRKMNPEAFREISVKGKSEYVQEENIGKMKYLSAYVPFRNNEDKVLAYLNLPYFAKQNELENEIASFLVQIINIFVLLFALSIVAGLFISNWITRPLKLLQERFGSIDLGKTNEPLHYERQDEIGSLVQEYNRKVAELEVKAELLARSERESAWREMAKQVAHEIKNPLTPMKLSVQHLKRSWDDKSPDWDERLNRFSESLVEQIDSLSNIASAFSNFAKMPSAQRKEFDIFGVLEKTIALYSQEAKNIRIHLSSDAPQPQIILADADQIQRVFSNLIKNSIQAIVAKDISNGEISILVSTSNEELQFQVTDNGVGISPERKAHIFDPSFTTKSTGTGLGLAMAKNIIESSGGKIWFSSKENQGTTFFISLPRIPADK